MEKTWKIEFLICILITFFTIFLPILVSASDYTQNCLITGSATCRAGDICEGGVQECYSNNCGVNCPASIGNSHFVNDNCSSSVIWNCGCYPRIQPPQFNICSGTAECQVEGICNYACDEGYRWTGENCVEFRADVDTVNTEGTVIAVEEVPPVGGLPSTAYSPPTPPAEGFSVVINNNALETDSRIVTLTLNGGSDTKRMAISNFSDFRYAVQETYQTTKTWILTEGEGLKTVYVKFYTAWGRASDVVSDTITLVITPPSLLTPEAQKIDTNKDNRIDILDFGTLMANWGAITPGNVADFNDDGIVDIFDFNLLMIHWTL